MLMAKFRAARRPHRPVGAGMLPPSYAPVAHSLRDEIIDQSEQQGIRLNSAAGRLTLDTNSILAPTRGRSLLRLLALRGAPPITDRSVLDLGAGFGSMSLYFATLGARVVGVDLKPERVELAERVARRHRLAFRGVVADISSLPFSADTFDFVVANNSLCYVVDRDLRHRAFDEISRVCSPGGWFIMRNPNRLYPRDQFTGLPLLPLLPPAAAAQMAKRRGRPRSSVRLQFSPRDGPGASTGGVPRGPLGVASPSSRPGGNRALPPCRGARSRGFGRRIAESELVDRYVE